jgi:hypothetical protein
LPGAAALEVHRRFVRLDDAKANYVAPDATAR